MILLWGALHDSPLAEVLQELDLRDTPYLLINQANILESKIELDTDCRIKGKINYLSKEYDSGMFKSAYIRTYDFTEEDGYNITDRNDPLFMNAIRFEQDMGIMLDNHPGRIVNRLSNCFSNSSKPFQMDVIKAHGFDVPETIITSSPQYAKDLLSKHNKIIYKSISSYRSIVSCITAKEVARLDDICWCPTQFQQYISGNDYRVHVLHDKIFTTKIISSESDYRYAKDTQLTDFKLPAAIEEKCFCLTQSLGLHFSGIDLRNNGNDQWYCFEVNPSPGYTYFSNATGQKITSELVDYLLNAPALAQPIPYFN